MLTPIFIWHTKRVFKKIAREVASEIKDYLDSGFEVTGILGIDGSPSCGVNKTVDVDKFVGLLAGAEIDKFGREQMNRMVKDCLADGRGYFIKALDQALRKRDRKRNIEQRVNANFELRQIPVPGGQPCRRDRPQRPKIRD